MGKSMSLVRDWRRAAVYSALGVALLAIAMPGAARAQDDDDTTIWNFDKKIMDKVMHGLGLQNGTEDNGIDYHERSPLVVPPTRSLPPPQAAAAAQAPNWPVDADSKRRQATNAKRRIDDSNWDQGNDMHNPAAAGGAPAASKPTTAYNDLGPPVKPSALGYTGGLFSNMFKTGNEEDYGTFTGEAPRTSLVQPPAGYQTPSPAQPYGVSKGKLEYGKATKVEDIPARTE